MNTARARREMFGVCRARELPARANRAANGDSTRPASPVALHRTSLTARAEPPAPAESSSGVHAANLRTILAPFRGCPGGREALGAATERATLTPLRSPLSLINGAQCLFRKNQHACQTEPLPQEPTCVPTQTRPQDPTRVPNGTSRTRINARPNGAPRARCLTR
ncbi:unnamed protein product [Lampetra planeri]